MVSRYTKDALGARSEVQDAKSSSYLGSDGVCARGAELASRSSTLGGCSPFAPAWRRVEGSSDGFGARAGLSHSRGVHVVIPECKKGVGSWFPEQ